MAGYCRIIHITGAYTGNADEKNSKNQYKHAIFELHFHLILKNILINRYLSYKQT